MKLLLDSEEQGGCRTATDGLLGNVVPMTGSKINSYYYGLLVASLSLTPDISASSV